MIEIILYEDKYQPDFKKLNFEWLDKYNLAEVYDLEILEDPNGKIIDKGGYIFLAVEDGVVLGTAGLAKKTNEEYELIKMAVDPLSRGRGIGKLLLKHCLQIAKSSGVKKISLFSNSHLQTALKMHEQFGFAHVEITDSYLLTADVKMELSLSSN